MNETLVTFLDNVSRTIIGKKIKEDENFLYVQNPIVVHSAPQQDQMGGVRMALQFFPIFFREFLADKNAPITFKYNKNTITVADNVVFDFKLAAQYNQIFAELPNNVPQAQPQLPVSQNSPATPNVIKLFD